MDDDELISALADGELDGEAFGQALQALGNDASALAAWHAYHVIGDVLRSPELAASSPASPFVQAVAARLAQEPGRPSEVAPSAPVRTLDAPAANDRRWKLLAGVASVAAFAAVGWSVLAPVAPGTSVPAASQLAAVPAAGGASAGPATVLARSEPGVMIRDPRLDELLAAHRQFGGASALQMPAGFVRNATFDGPSR